MSNVSDLDINRGVRRVLVKHWIDLGRLSVRSTNGKVYIYGRLQRLPGTEGNLMGTTVDSMFYQIKRIGGVTSVNPHLENWTDDDGLWRPVEAGKEGSATIIEADEIRTPGQATISLGNS